jgi:predicted cupin superfamily sugar epimerase
MHSAQYWKQKLQLTSHVEGGSYKEIYRSSLVLPQGSLTLQHNGNRNAMTSIYFLLEHGEFSAFHRIASDELWHHYYGDDLSIYEIDTNSTLTRHLLGNSPAASPFVSIRAGSWFGSRAENPNSYTLCGCTVAPGFDFADFELANRDALTALYPAHHEIIAELTR